MRKHLVAGIAIALAGAGCAAAGTDRSGGATPETLVLASNDGEDLDGAPAVAHFVERVAELSDGRLQVEVEAGWKGGGGEPRVLRDVANGEADLAWSGTRAFDRVGVDAFRPLHAPFLIGSYAAQAAVVSDPVVGDLLASTEDAGLTGLALLADELRFPAGAEGPLVSPEDFEGLSFGVAESDVQTATFEALGADVGTLGRPNQAGSDGFEGLETMWWTYVANGLWLTYPFVTENAALWPRTSVIVADTDRFEELDEADRETLREAAAEATSWSVEHASDRVLEQRESMCAMGARVVTASPAQLDALRGAAQPAYDTIREDPVQADHLAALEELLSGVEAEPVPLPPGCAYQPGDEERILAYQAPEPIDGPGRPGDLPAGTYRYSVTEEEVMTYGLMNEEGARANAGVWTWTLGDGNWGYEMEPSSDDVPGGYAGNTCEGFYDVRGSSVSFTRETVYAQGECAPPTWRAEWSESDNGLRMRVSSDGPDIDFLFGGKKWERID